MIAWVTGGGTGIGRALAGLLYKRGDRVAISGRRAEVLSKTAGDIAAGSGPGEIAAFPLDVSDAVSVSRVAAEIRQRFGPVDLLINNAGLNAYHVFDETSLKEFEESFRVNCLGAIACTKEALSGMRERNAGAIVNISSVLGKWGSCNSAAYSVGKYAVAGFTDVLRQDLAGTRIHVLGVYPGFIKTDMTARFVPEESFKANFGKSPEAMARAILQALRRKRAELHYPWYVPWMVRLYRWMPGFSDRMARRVRR